MSKSRFKLIPEVHLVLRRENRFLMLRRQGTGYMDGYHSLVAGHVDGAETFRTAMIREAKEEAGISIDARHLRLVHTMHRRSDDERLSLFFEASSWSGILQNMEPHKCDDLNWYTMAEKDSELVPYVRSALLHVYRNSNYSEFGWP